MEVVDAMDVQPNDSKETNMQAESSNLSLQGPATSQEVGPIATVVTTNKLNGTATHEMSFALNGHVNTLQRPLRTGYVYDSRMMNHWPLVGEDENNSHPEQPQRIFRVYSILKNNLCIPKMQQIPVRSLEKHEAILVHSEDHWEKVEAIALMDEDAIKISEEYYERLSLYVHRDTPTVAKLSAGGVIETCLSVARGELRNAFAIVRPPGHHAEPEEHMGFCFFNNVAIAVRVVQQLTPIKKILILDWDVHHGNGTQRAFWTDETVLYISLHRYEGGCFYPTGPFGSLQSCGEGKGLGTSVNIPWPRYGMGDADYLYAFEKIVMPIAYEWAPELVIISAGFDAAAGDHLGLCEVTPSGYAHMTHMLASLAGGKLVVALEGGYNLEALSNSALAVTKILLGEAPPELPPMVACEDATETVWQVAMQQSKYWKCMHPKEVEPRSESRGATISIPELLKLYRAEYLFREHKMFQIPFVDDQLAARFDGQMLCTQNVYAGTGTLVVFMHDLCNLRVELDGSAYCNVAQERSYLEDATKQIIDWLTNSPNTSYIDLNLNSQPIMQTRIRISTYNDDVDSVVTYIWDNYIELSESRHIVFVCHGPGCRAIMNLIKKRDVKRKVRAIVHIVSTGVPPKSPQDETQMWYRKRTLICVPKTSRVFDDNVNILKRYGVVQSYAVKTASQLISAAIAGIKSFIGQKVDDLENARAMEDGS